MNIVYAKLVAGKFTGFRYKVFKQMMRFIRMNLTKGRTHNNGYCQRKRQKMIRYFIRQQTFHSNLTCIKEK